MDWSTEGFPCPSLCPGVLSTSCPLSQWCHPTISSSAALFSFCLQSFPASRSFPMSQLFISVGQNIGASASASVLSMSIQGWFPLGLTGWISVATQGTLKNLLQHHSLKASVLQCSAFFMVQLSLGMCSVFWVTSVMSDSLQPHGLYPARLLCPWDSPGKNTRVDCHTLLQGIFLTQGSYPHLLQLLHCRQILYLWSTGEVPH